ncbi:unnamed protein product [Lasius platythorax]|uniref:Uncharacterized protein n=1 Tax=Lasius platythorax TaxID=488582 RepID=A0AAV2NYC0_9HYME
MKAFHRNLKDARYKDQEPRGHAPGGAFETRFRDDKDSPEITKIPERVRVHTNDRRYIESRSIVSYMPYPNGSKGHRRKRVPYAHKLPTDTRLASDVLSMTMSTSVPSPVIAIVAIYLDPRVK